MIKAEKLIKLIDKKYNYLTLNKFNDSHFYIMAHENKPDYYTNGGWLSNGDDLEISGIEAKFRGRGECEFIVERKKPWFRKWLNKFFFELAWIHFIMLCPFALIFLYATVTGKTKMGNTDMVCFIYSSAALFTLVKQFIEKRRGYEN